MVIFFYEKCGLRKIPTRGQLSLGLSSWSTAPFFEMLARFPWVLPTESYEGETVVEEPHEVLGVTAAASLIATVALVGSAAYGYRRGKSLLALQRSTLVRFHFWMAAALLSAAAFHYLLAPSVHGAQLAGVLALVIVFLMGVSFRWSRKYFQVAIQAKIVPVLFAAISLPVGHWLVGEVSHKDWESRGRPDRPAAGAAGAGFETDRPLQERLGQRGTDVPWNGSVSTSRVVLARSVIRASRGATLYRSRSGS
jgi:hypothetical protein